MLMTSVAPTIPWQRVLSMIAQQARVWNMFNHLPNHTYPVQQESPKDIKIEG